MPGVVASAPRFRTLSAKVARQKDGTYVGARILVRHCEVCAAPYPPYCFDAGSKTHPLGRWRCWSCRPQALGVFAMKSYNVSVEQLPIVIRGAYALSTQPDTDGMHYHDKLDDAAVDAVMANVATLNSGDVMPIRVGARDTGLNLFRDGNGVLFIIGPEWEGHTPEQFAKVVQWAALDPVE